ncbi:MULTISPECIES: hypothetical protein [unclassified Bartonella]|uniref:hypothetical protein n=1 Tax=unclassified Bartonella TaxID=2645622 RepID=UPI00300DE674
MSHTKQVGVMIIDAINAEMRLRVVTHTVMPAPPFYGRQPFTFLNNYTVRLNEVAHAAFRILTYVKQNAYRRLSPRGNTCCCCSRQQN